MNQAIILFAHGARDPLWAEPFIALRARVAAHHDGPVELAFLEIMQPDLETCAGKLIDKGISAIRIVPCFMARGTHLRRDLPALVSTIQARHTGVSINLTEALGEVACIQDAMASWIARQGAKIT